jgi:hypothetical protein
MDIGKLTALAVDRAHRSGKPLMLSDGSGLYLRKQTKGGASWTLRHRFGGQDHWLTLGNFPDMSGLPTSTACTLPAAETGRIATLH